MEDAMAARYWCHMCSQMVNPIGDVEIKCPFCQSGFVEEMSSPVAARDNNQEPDPEFGADRALSLWAPILLGMMGNSRRRRRVRRADGEGGYEDENEHEGESRPGEESELDREIESIIRRRRRSSATILQLLQGIQAGMAAESENAEGDRERERDRDREREMGVGGDRERERERERVILINPFNQTIIVQGASHDPNQNHNHNPVGSLGDYFIGPGLDLLLQHLAENDPNRHGTPPAKQEAVEAMPSVKIEEALQCSVCLDDMEAGTEAKEMPCKHKFHPDCILPWLELHSSCPVCRFQMPADESKRESDGAARDGSIREDVGDTVNGRRLSFPWPFMGLFSSAPAPHGLGLFPSPNAPPTGLFPPAPPGNAPATASTSSAPPGNSNASQAQPDDD